MQKAYNAIELLEDTVTPGLSELKVRLYRVLITSNVVVDTLFHSDRFSEA